jgi:hypothetical protein
MIMHVAALDVLTMKGGFAPEAARAIGEAMDMEIARSRETLATSQQLTEARDSLSERIEEVNRTLSDRIEEMGRTLTARIDKLEHSLRTDIAVLSTKIDGMVQRSEFDAKLDSFRHEIDAKLAKLHSGVVRWVFVVALGFWAAQAGTTIALVRLLVPHPP